MVAHELSRIAWRTAMAAAFGNSHHAWLLAPWKRQKNRHRITKHRFSAEHVHEPVLSGHCKLSDERHSSTTLTSESHVASTSVNCRRGLPEPTSAGHLGLACANRCLTSLLQASIALLVRRGPSICCPALQNRVWLTFGVDIFSLIQSAYLQPMHQ